MKYRIQEHYKQTNKKPKTEELQTNKRKSKNTVFHLFVCSAPLFSISFVCL
jgi:hypothetical protein